MTSITHSATRMTIPRNIAAIALDCSRQGYGRGQQWDGEGHRIGRSGSVFDRCIDARHGSVVTGIQSLGGGKRPVVSRCGSDSRLHTLRIRDRDGDDSRGILSDSSIESNRAHLL